MKTTPDWTNQSPLMGGKANVSPPFAGSTAGLFSLAILGILTVLMLGACGTVVRGTMGVANSISDAREAARDSRIAQESIARYQAMADAGNPKGIYYMAIAYALRHENDDAHIHEIKRRYEEAVAKGSIDAKVALGRLLVTGDSHPFIGDQKLPVEELDPERGIALLQEAADRSCSFTQPLVGIDTCRERESSVPVQLSHIYFNGIHRWIRDEAAAAACAKKDYACLMKAGHYQEIVPKDRERSDMWRQRARQCDAEIARINRSRGCHL